MMQKYAVHHAGLSNGVRWKLMNLIEALNKINQYELSTNELLDENSVLLDCNEAMKYYCERLESALLFAGLNFKGELHWVI